MAKTDNREISDVLEERGRQYGTFKDHAFITQALKRNIYSHAEIHNVSFTDSQKEAIDMICHKLGRIANGNPNLHDSWIDIAGYAKLEADILSESSGVEASNYEPMGEKQ